MAASSAGIKFRLSNPPETGAPPSAVELMVTTVGAPSMAYTASTLPTRSTTAMDPGRFRASASAATCPITCLTSASVSRVGVSAH